MSEKNIQPMNSVNPEITPEKRQAKKDVVLGSGKNKHIAMIVAAACAVLIVGGAIFYASYDRSATAPVAASSSSDNSQSQVTFPASLFEDGQARHFEHVSGKFHIKYFILKSSDGVIRAAFDACDVCWPAGKGYFQEGDFMVCRNCGRRFASIQVNEVKGGCNPAPLNRKVENGRVVIEVKDILEGIAYFNFPGKV